MNNSRTIRLQIAATETHCRIQNGRPCDFLSPYTSKCLAFGHKYVELDSGAGYEYKRLPECIAAEEEAGK